MTPSAIQNEHVKRLEWAIRFSQVDLLGLREGDWINLRGDLYDFMQYSRERPGLLGGPSPTREHGMDLKRLCTKAKEKDISRLQRDLKLTLLDFVCYDEVVAGEFPPTPVGANRLLPIKGAMLSAYGSKPDEPFEWQIRWAPPGNLQTSALAALFRHLVSSRIPWSKLRICPECRRIFLLSRRPRPDMSFHCSLRCSRNAATRRYRERLARAKGGETRAKERERSHRRYVEKQKKKGLRNVARIPRKQKGKKSTPSTIEYAKGGPISIANPGKVGK